MTCKSLDVLAISLESLLKKIDDSCTYLLNIGQPVGLCMVSPKGAFINRPTNEIKNEIEKQAIEHFKGTNVEVLCYRYFAPPLVPLPLSNKLLKTVSIDDYQISFYHPNFDEQWKQTEVARSLICCPQDPIHHEWSDWFEPQLEAIRFTPILEQHLKECQIISIIERKLSLPGTPVFESFVYEYATNDLNFHEMSKLEKERWKTRKIDWRIRYRLAEDIIKSEKTLYGLYTIARKKATSSRNLILKPLFWAFAEYVECNLIQLTDLPEEKKKQFISQLRQTKKRASNGKYVAKRPALCISDVECAQVLNLMIHDFLVHKKRTMSLAEAIIFIWIAQQGAFSGLHLTLDNIFSITFADINFNDSTISINNQEIHLTEGLNRILSEWLGNVKEREQQALFENITYDSLEDIISKVSVKFSGMRGRLSPRDFLEKVHVIPGVRISLELRRQITAQEQLVKNSPYRINTRNIKFNIKEAIRNRSVGS